MTDQPVPCLLVIGRDLIFLHKCQDDLQDVPVHGHAQRTVCIGYNIVDSSGVKIRSPDCLPCPSRRGTGLCCGSRKDRPFRRRVPSPARSAPDQNPRSVPGRHTLFLLEFQLPFVGHLLDLAAAALTREPAPGLHPMRGRIDDPHQPSVSVIFLRLYNFYFHSVTDHSVFNKEGVAVEFSNALAAYTDISDLYDCRIIFSA